MVPTLSRPDRAAARPRTACRSCSARRPCRRGRAPATTSASVPSAAVHLTRPSGPMADRRPLAAHGVDRPVGAERGRRRLAARAEVDRPDDLRLDARARRLQRVQRALGVGRAVVGAEADVHGAVADDGRRGVPRRAAGRVKAPARRKLIARTGWIVQREQRAAVQADVRGPVRARSRPSSGCPSCRRSGRARRLATC